VTLTARTAAPAPGRLPGSLEEVVDELRAGGHDAQAVTADLSRPGERERIVADATREKGPITVLVNNAAVTWFAPAAGFDERHWQLMFEVQVRAPFHLAELVLPGMRAAGRGWILNVSSGAARHPVGPPFHRAFGGTVYGMCKAALERFTTGLAGEVHADGIAVNALSPSKVVPTPGTVHHNLVGHPGQEVEPAERFAEAALALCTGDPTDVTGRVTYTDEVLAGATAEGTP
jgi:citronellol/citronellal dehydrogenase